MKWLTLLGLVIIAFALMVEAIPGSSPGLGAYQFCALAFGLNISALGVTRSNSALTKVFLVFLGILFALGSLEIGVFLLERVNRSQLSTDMNALNGLIPDKELGLRMPANAPGHDANGFRNASIPEYASIVAIGDSQTWGNNANREETWPYVLARLSEKSVYSMAMGGYGPVQYAVLAKQALQYSPDLVIVGLYFGNDFYDAYRIVYLEDTYSDMRIADHTKLLPDMISERATHLGTQRTDYLASLQQNQPIDFLKMFTQQTAVGRLLLARGVLASPNANAGYQADLAWAEHFPEHGAIYRTEESSIVFTPSYRLLVLDLDDPRIQEGLRLTKQLLEDSAQDVEQYGAELIVLLIPTKELVYSELIQKYSSLGPSFEELVVMETTARSDVISFLEAQQIRFVDSLPLLRAAAEQNRPIYPSGVDGHPWPQGYAILAEAVNAVLQATPAEGQ
jgi:hypothetical protein